MPAYAAALHPQAEAWAWVGRGTKVGLRRISTEDKMLQGEGASVGFEKGRFGMVVKFVSHPHFSSHSLVDRGS